MLYISTTEREDWEEILSDIDDIAFYSHNGETLFGKGDLSYLITKLCLMYIRIKEKNYTTLSDVVGVLECTKSEFIRRMVDPYEDEKIKENEDVF